MSMRTDDFDYNLPEELIAQAPAEPRDSCRLLVVDRKGSQAGTPLEHGGTVEHRIFRDIIDYIEPGDVLVINKTRVMPARLIGRKAARAAWSRRCCSSAARMWIRWAMSGSACSSRVSA